jgi:hypothetical protein
VSKRNASKLGNPCTAATREIIKCGSPDDIVVAGVADVVLPFIRASKVPSPSLSTPSRHCGTWASAAAHGRVMAAAITNIFIRLFIVVFSDTSIAP